MGLLRSKWASPFKISQDLSREQALARYEKYLARSGLIRQVGELGGKVLLCHCRRDKACHGDVLLEALGRAGYMVSLNDRIWLDGVPVDDGVAKLDGNDSTGENFGVSLTD